MSNIECPVCKSAAVDNSPNGLDGHVVSCPRCGNFSISGSAIAMWKDVNPTPRVIANASGWIRENQVIQILSQDVDSLLSIRTPSVADRATKILIELAKQSNNIASSFELFFINPNSLISIEEQEKIKKEQLNWLGIAYSENLNELMYLTCDYLQSEVNLVTASNRGSCLDVRITPKGHAFLDEIKKTPVDSQIGFCAMWFDISVLPIWTNAIEPAIKDAGYDAKRIDTDHHNNRIDDEIIVMLRRSKFVVADFTGQRGGVYFEAGFALGFGLQVIWTCKKSELDEKKIHFDTRQYNFVTWEENKLDEFKVALQNRIEATIGRGNFS